MSKSRSKAKRRRKSINSRKSSAQNPVIIIGSSPSANAVSANKRVDIEHALAKEGIRLPRAAFFFVLVIFYEIVFRILTVERFFGAGLAYILLFAVPAAIIMDIICGLFTPRTNRKITVASVAAMTIFYGAQLIYKNIFGTYMIFFSILHGGEAFTYYREIIVKVLQNLPSLLLILLPFVFVLAYGKSHISYARLPAKRFMRRLISAVCCTIICVCTLVFAGTGEFTPFDLFFRTSDINFSVDRLGMSTSMQIDIIRSVTGFEPDFNIEPDAVTASAPPKVEYQTTAPPSTVPSTTAPQTEASTEPVTEAPPAVFVPQPNIIDIDFEKLIENETNAELVDLHKYFSSVEPTQTNEKTGMFAGSNVIFIVAEGFSHYVIDPELTPTLYKMATEGFEFTNFYNPVWSVSTSDGEYVAAQGLIPKSGVWSFYRSYDNWLPFQLGRQMQRLGYVAKGYHNHSATYYDRNLSHPNMGYDFKAVGMGLEMTKSWPESDLEMIDITTADYVNDAPFHAYYMTVSGHLLYNFTGNNMAYRHREVTAHLPYSEAVRAYLACNYELELAMTLLLERLDEAGQLENTVIVISADHYPYGLTEDEISEIAGHKVDSDFELYKSALIIYKPGTPHEVIDRPVSSLDILPTVSNLLGLEFDSRLLMGIDAFSDTEPLVIFSNRSFITADARYSTKTKELIPNEGAELPEGYRKYWSNVINQKFSYSAKILDFDYYRVLFPEDAERAEALDTWRNPGGSDE